MSDETEGMEFMETCPYWKRMMAEPKVQTALATFKGMSPLAHEMVIMLMGMAYASGGMAATDLCRVAAFQAFGNAMAERVRGGGNVANG